jgi:hypothetical protein
MRLLGVEEVLDGAALTVGGTATMKQLGRLLSASRLRARAPARVQYQVTRARCYAVELSKVVLSESYH